MLIGFIGGFIGAFIAMFVLGQRLLATPSIDCTAEVIRKIIPTTANMKPQIGIQPATYQDSIISMILPKKARILAGEKKPNKVVNKANPIKPIKVIALCTPETHIPTSRTTLTSKVNCYNDECNHSQSSHCKRKYSYASSRKPG